MVDPRVGHHACTAAQGEGDDRADAGGSNPRVRPRRTDSRTATSALLEKPDPRTRSPATRSTRASTSSARTFDRIPRTRPRRSSEATSPSLIQRGETFVAYVYTGYDRHRNDEKDLQVHRHHGRPYLGAAFNGRPSRSAWVSARGTLERGRRRVHGPSFDEGAVVKAGARIRPTA